MALIKIYTTPEHYEELHRSVARTIKLISAAVLNVPEMSMSPSSVETVVGEGIDLIGIDYILEVIAIERPRQQQIANNMIVALNAVYPDKFFSVYFNTISEVGMANTPRPDGESSDSAPITINEAITLSKKEVNS